MDAKSDVGESRSTPNRRLTIMLHNYHKDFGNFRDTPMVKELKKKNSITASPVKKHEKEAEKKVFYPNNLELIQKMKKFKSINDPVSLFNSNICNSSSKFYSDFGKSLTLQRKINERKNFIEYELPEDPNQLDQLLRTIKETERVIRQENEFIYKVRKFKPKIQLKLRTRSDSSNSESKFTRFNRKRNKTPVTLSRSGIQVSSFN